MNYLYLFLDLGSVLIPLLFSFHPRIKFYKEWKIVFLSILIMMLIFIPWDIVFTINGYWGFNDQYLSGLYFLHLPIEEWLFFICIPYACLFTHFSLEKLLFYNGLKDSFTKFIAFAFIGISLSIALLNIDRSYTFINFLLVAIITTVTYLFKRKLLNTFFISYIVIILPFLIVNGVLTGTIIPDEVVWYNNNENLGIRVLTIPLEDFFYAFSMLLVPQFTLSLIKSWTSRKVLLAN